MVSGSPKAATVRATAGRNARSFSEAILSASKPLPVKIAQAQERATLTLVAGGVEMQDIAEALARRGQLGQPLRGRHGVGPARPAVEAEFARHERADGQCHKDAGLALVRAQGLAAVWAVGGFGGEIDVPSYFDECGGDYPVDGV